MKPSVTIDERGVLLHLTDVNGRGVAVALNAETLAELKLALERIKTPGTRGKLLWSAAAAAVKELLGNPEKKADGPPEPDPARKENS